MSELLPCRFCGTVPETVLRHGVAPGGTAFRYVTHACRGPEARLGSAARDQWNAANAPADPALLALARLGAAVVREMGSPRYAHSFTWDESRVLDILAHDAGVRVHVNPADQVLSPGIADAIAALLAPDGAASEGVDDGD